MGRIISRNIIVALIVGIVIISITSCGKYYKDEQLVTNKNNKNVEKGVTTGIEEKDVVLYLVSTTWCLSCKEELHEMKQVIDNIEDIDFQIISLLYDAEYEEAADWIKVNSVPWKVQIDGLDEFSIAENECPELSFPCILIYKKDNGFVFKHNGKIPANELVDIVGEYL